MNPEQYDWPPGSAGYTGYEGDPPILGSTGISTLSGPPAHKPPKRRPLGFRAYMGKKPKASSRGKPK